MTTAPPAETRHTPPHLGQPHLGQPHLAPPRLTANPAPVRPAGSVRRTASIDVEWLGDMDGERRLHGRARDILTPAGGSAPAIPRVLAEARMEAVLTFDRTITALAATPSPARLPDLVGQRGGGHLRMAMAEVLPELIAAADPLYLLLDDISGISLISSWAWSLWNPDWLRDIQEAMAKDQFEKMTAARADVCWGLRTGNSGLNPDRESLMNAPADGGELRHPADPAGWHDFPEISGVSMRRARRIDVWRDAPSGLIHIDSAFQDSAPRPQKPDATPDGAAGGRAALHEYRLTATVDPDTLELLTLEPEPRVLPFAECPGAVANARALVGTPLPNIRAAVLAELRGPAGCTHLNDALRALAEVPMLLAQLPG